MTKFALLTGAALMTFGSAAIAQTTAPAGTTPASTVAPSDMATKSDMTPPADSAAPAATPDTTAQTTSPTATAQTEMTKPGDPAAPAAAPAATANATTPAATTQTAANVQADWSKYDKDAKGKLTPLEFGEWVMAAQGQDLTAKVNQTRTSKSANLPAVKILNATATSFAKADTDHDKLISPEELTAFLAG